MNRRLLIFPLILITLCILPLVVFAAVDNSRFQEANAAYSRNDFHSAISIYEDLLNDYGYSPGVLYNLANSYAEAGRPGKAILNYERALRLAPNDSDIIGNLQLVRTANGLFTRDATFTERVLHFMSMNQWTGMAGLGAVALTVILVLSIRFRFSPMVLTLLSLSCLAMVAAGIVNALALRQEWSGGVVTGNCRLQISPFEGAAAAGNIQEGRMVYPKKEHGDYIFVEDETGRQGWLQQSVFEPVVPPRK
jgi:tetratricopeptide (TPR) repeat protein